MTAEPKAPVWRVDRRHSYREAENLAACAMVAAKVYESFGWIRYHGPSPLDDDAYHVPGAEEIMHVLGDLGRKALAQRDDEHFEQVGFLRFVAYADSSGDDACVDFYITVGSAEARELLTPDHGSKADA